MHGHPLHGCYYISPVHSTHYSRVHRQGPLEDRKRRKERKRGREKEKRKRVREREKELRKEMVV